jgi:phage shock protein PspC (stress-responsive transcriptional regulator)
MKKALQISLARTLFTIEDDAYAKLDNYLSSLRIRFDTTDGKDEIMNDIESRIAEQFLESKKNIITLGEVGMVIASMGSDEEFDEAEKASPAPKKSSTRKLYRDTENSVIAGVCSGLGKYFSIDPLLVRIIFVIFIFATGFGALIYIFMWIFVPEAKTAGQKLEMGGNPVTIDTLSKSIREKIEEVKKRHRR